MKEGTYVRNYFFSRQNPITQITFERREYPGEMNVLTIFLNEGTRVFLNRDRERSGGHCEPEDQTASAYDKLKSLHRKYLDEVMEELCLDEREMIRQKDKKLPTIKHV